MLEQVPLVYKTSVLRSCKKKRFDCDNLKKGFLNVAKRIVSEMNKWVAANAEEIVNVDIELQLLEKWMGV